MNVSSALRSRFVPALLSLGLAVGSVQAAVVTSQIGVDDGLGLGVQAGEVIDYFSLPLGTGPGEWHDGGGFSAALNSSWSGQLVSARLELFAGGWGLDGQAQVFLNNVLIGLVTEGDLANLGDNYATFDAFDLIDPLGLLNVNADNSFEVRTSGPDDAGVLGFARLTLTTRDAANAVPEPASYALAGLALAGALVAWRRQAR